MLDFMKDENDALVILKKDHDTVKELFEKFKKAKSMATKKSIAMQAITELRVHATIEEEIFYPVLRGKKAVDQKLLNEADEEHHVAKLLIGELMAMKTTDHFEAKFTVLAENIEHHVKEEEHDLFPQARKTDVDFIKVGKKLLARKKDLLKNGIPMNAEEKLMQKNPRVDSPAKAAKKKAA